MDRIRSLSASGRGSIARSALRRRFAGPVWMRSLRPSTAVKHIVSLQFWPPKGCTALAADAVPGRSSYRSSVAAPSRGRRSEPVPARSRTMEQGLAAHTVKPGTSGRVRSPDALPGC